MPIVVQASAIAVGAALLTASLLPTLLGGWWVASLLANFRPHLMLAGGLAIVLGLLARSVSLSTLGAGALVVNAVAIAAASGTLAPAPEPPAAPDRRPELRVMTLNLLFTNRDLEALERCVAEAKPDLLLVQEAGRFWVAALAALADQLPYRLALSSVGDTASDHGVMLLSQHPILEAEHRPLADVPNRLAAIRLEIFGQSLWAASVHVVKPTSAANLDRQRQQFDDLARWVASRDTPLILGGDLNATVYMPHLQRFAAATGLHADRPGQAWGASLGPTGAALLEPFVASTFPAALPLFGLKIDHVMVRDLEVRRARTLPCPGSDHRAVVVDLDLDARQPAMAESTGTRG